jgi:hypothetical protein
MRAALVLIVTTGIAVAAGVLGFQAGVASNIGTAGGTVVLGGGFHVFGLFLFMGFLFFSFLALAAILGGRRRHRGRWGMHGAMGPGGHGPAWPGTAGGPGTDPRRAWIAEVHRSLHDEEARSGAASGDASGAGA